MMNITIQFSSIRLRIPQFTTQSLCLLIIYKPLKTVWIYCYRSKQSFRRLCFYTCLSVILFTGGVCIIGGVCIGGVCIQGGWADNPPPPNWILRDTVNVPSGYPTGMHSCCWGTGFSLHNFLRGSEWNLAAFKKVVQFRSHLEQTFSV